MTAAACWRRSRRRSTSPPRLLTSIRAATDGRDGPGLRRAAHELAGSAANLGAVRVADLARRIEDAAGGDAVDAVLVDRLAVELDDARRSLSEVLRA
ncbi:Hpt domain-containing protein [Nocardioides sp. T2.26MG-1]|uniref:Hpt domain-containing protein n=1 Tax=Nocardioides sp. T2.26MG-1 TaxID=3041166 RepID=UPI00406CA6F8